ncbi:MAG: hypothetical protein ABIJ18_04725 [archaeon]
MKREQIKRPLEQTINACTMPFIFGLGTGFMGLIGFESVMAQDYIPVISCAMGEVSLLLLTAYHVSLTMELEGLREYTNKIRELNDYFDEIERYHC